LVTSPGFAKAFAFNLATLTTLAIVTVHVEPTRALAMRALHQFQLGALTMAHRYAWWSAISLLSSSCCALQLLLNLFSFGCAGFNKVLGPVRPTLLSATLLAQVWMWSVALSEQRWQIPSMVGLSMLTATLTFLPEAIDAYTRALQARIARHPVTDAAGVRHEVRVSVPSIGCVACVNKISKVLSEHSRASEIESVHTSVESACVVLVVRAQRLDDLLASIEAALSAAGFAPAERATRELAPDAPDALRFRGGSLTAGPPAAAAVVAAWWQHTGSLACGLLASSCCLVQLALNALSVGCAGFNTVLGPWRTHLRALTLVWLSALWMPAARARRLPARAVLLSTTLSLVLTFMPEMLRLSGGPSLAPPTSDVFTLALRVEGMGCEACEQAVRQALASTGGVVDARARFESGVVECTVARDWNFDIAEATRRVQAAGFELVVDPGVDHPRELAKED
jgi:copper chaperone CopZ